MRYHPVKMRLFLIWLCARIPQLTPVIAAYLYKIYQKVKGSEYVLPPFGALKKIVKFTPR